MLRKAKILLALLASLHLVMGCAARHVYGPGGKVSELPAGSLEARVCPEVRLHTKGGGQFQVGKIVGLETRLVRFLPAPYWSVVSQKIDLGDIARIDVTVKKGSPGRAGLAGFGWGVLISGFIGAVSSRYNVDYESWLATAPVAGAAIGLVAMGISAMSAPGKEISYDLAAMRDEEKAFVILKLMGFKQS